MLSISAQAEVESRPVVSSHLIQGTLALDMALCESPLGCSAHQLVGLASEPQPWRIIQADQASVGTVAVVRLVKSMPVRALPPALLQPSHPTRTLTLIPHFVSGRVAAGLGHQKTPLGI
jgi:hypothetical protein